MQHYSIYTLQYPSQSPHPHHGCNPVPVCNIMGDTAIFKGCTREIEHDVNTMLDEITAEKSRPQLRRVPIDRFSVNDAIPAEHLKELVSSAVYELETGCYATSNESSRGYSMVPSLTITSPNYRMDSDNGPTLDYEITPYNNQLPIICRSSNNEWIDIDEINADNVTFFKINIPRSLNTVSEVMEYMRQWDGCSNVDRESYSYFADNTRGNRDMHDFYEHYCGNINPNNKYTWNVSPKLDAIDYETFDLIDFNAVINDMRFDYDLYQREDGTIDVFL